MGQEIVYCSECAVRLTGTDFEKGKAFRVEHKCLCAGCAKKILGKLPEHPTHISKPSTQRVQAPQSDTGTPARLSESTVARGMPTAPAKKSSGLLIGAALGAVAVLAIVVAVASSGGPATPTSRGVDGPTPPETSAREREAGA